MIKKIVFIIIVVFLSTNVYAGHGFFELIEKTQTGKINELKNTTWVITGEWLCESNYVLVQLYEPNYFVFAIDPKCQNKYRDIIPEAGSTFFMKVPQEMYNKCKKTPAAINRLFAINFNWFQKQGKEWGINEKTQKYISRCYVVKDIFEVTMNTGIVVKTPVVQPYIYSNMPIEKIKNIAFRYQEYIKNR